MNYKMSQKCNKNVTIKSLINKPYNVNILEKQKKNGGIQMFIFDISNPLTLILMLAATILLIFLAQEIKKSYVNAIPLFTYLIILVIHVAQIMTLPENLKNLSATLSRCIAIDFVFILISFFAYLWVDDIESKKLGKKSIDNSLDWFWKKV